VLSALVNGVPQLVTPQWTADLLEYATRVTKIGVGRHLGPDDDYATTIGGACRDVLDDPSYATRAREVSAQLASLPDPAIVVAAIERLVH
jgi:UDP:flavonoid glycosyltransferase YjiC (YdhE family)